MFADQGIRRVTVDDLVGAAGFTRGAFYSNFESIEELFFAVFEQQSRLMIDAVRETVDAVPDDEFTTGSISLLLDSVMPYARTWYLIQAEFTLLALRNPEAREVFTGHHHLLEQEMAELIGDIVRRLGRVPTVPIERVTEVAIALYLHALAHEGLGTGSLDPASLVEDVLPQVLLGLSRPAE